MKKILSKVLIAFAAIMMTGVFTGCHEADPEFVHVDFYISKLTMRPSVDKAAKTYEFTIVEYNAKGEDITAALADAETDDEKVALGEGGYGLATVEVPITEMEDMDITKAYLQAELTYDEIIIPGLVGPHDIANPDASGVNQGMVVHVKAGSGKLRPYRIIGTYN